MAWIEDSWAPIVLSSFAGSGRGFVVDAREVDYLAGTQRFMSAASEKANLGLRVAFAIAMTAPFWLTFRFRTLRTLAPEERSAIMARLLLHPIFFVRELTLLLKLVACLGIFRSAEALARTDYERPLPEATGTRNRALPVLGASGAVQSKAIQSQEVA